MKHGKLDYAALEPAAQHQPIAYAKPDGALTFDRLSSVFLSNTTMRRIADPPPGQDMAQKRSEHDVFAGPRAVFARLPSMSGWKSHRVRLRRDRTGNEAGAPQRDRPGSPSPSSHQRAELCSANLRHQGPEPEHQLVPPQGGEGPVYQNM